MGRSEPSARRTEGVAASEIKVAGFRQIFLWPLTLSAKDVESQGGTDSLESAVRRIGTQLERSGDWERQTDLLKHCKPLHGEYSAKSLDEENAHAYAEYVYFYDFFQKNFLSEGPNRRGFHPVSLFQRIGNYDGCCELRRYRRRTKFTFRFDRLNLYVFATGAVVFVAEVTLDTEVEASQYTGENVDEYDALEFARRPLTLADVQDFADHFRRVYPPFFGRDGGNESDASVRAPGRVPHDVVIYRTRRSEKKNTSLRCEFYNGKTAKDPAYDLDQMLAAIKDKNLGVPPVFGHWLEMLAPLAIAGLGQPVRHPPLAHEPQLRQIVDERMPVMSFVEIATCDGSEQKALLDIGRGDWIRLCFADESGSARTPYSEPFLGDFERRYCYDRFFPHSSNSNLSLSIMNCGYHFVLVGAGSFASKTAIHHFRRHYFQIGLALQMGQASLLAISGRITHAVHRLKSSGDNRRSRQQFAYALRLIEEDFLNYTHLFHYGDVSGQLQARELYDLWHEQLGIGELYNDVRAEIDTANHFLMASEQAEMAEDTKRLNIIAAVGVVLGVVFALLGMNVLFRGENSLDGLASASDWKLLGGVMAVIAALGAAALWFSFGAERWRDRESAYYLMAIAAVGASFYAFAPLLASLFI